jgi:SAM-dependent methyltransferase
VNLKQRIDQLTARSPYGWGHTIDFPGFTIDGILGRCYQDIATHLDSYQFWPDLTNLNVADVGCFSGGLSLLMSQRGAKVIAVDEIPEHLEQCSLVAEAYEQPIELVCSSLYHLEEHIRTESLDLILCSGVLYHLSDMLVGLLALQKLLKSHGVLIIESNAVEDYERSYANFGRFYAGMWWQPTALCIQDMLGFTGYEGADIRFYMPGRCLVRAVKSDKPCVPFRRGMTYQRGDVMDQVERGLDPAVMRPARGK